MSVKFKISAIAVLIVSILFYLFFEISKQDAVFSSVNPFAEDPYDAIGSFGTQAAAFLAILSCVRAFWPYPTNTESGNQRALLARTQMMTILAVGITLAGDAVAMLRHSSLWDKSYRGHQLAGLGGGMALVSAVAGWLVYRVAHGIALPVVPHVWRRAAIVSFAAALILALYPATLRQSMPGALFTAIVGMTLLFVPMWALGTALVPYRIELGQYDTAWLVRLYSRKYLWGLIVLTGILTGFFLALAELRGNGGWPHLTSKVFFVTLVYVGLETTGILMGYVLLRRPLGLFSQSQQQQ